MKKGFLLTLCVILLCGCEPKQRKPKITGAYTIFIGSAAFAAGYLSDSYKIDNNMISFVDKKTGKEIISPLCSVSTIERNSALNHNTEDYHVPAKMD